MKSSPAVALTVALALSACGTNPAPTANVLKQPPTATLKPLDKIGAGEGQLNLIAWEGYADDSWVKPFQDQTGCQVHVQYAGSPQDMLNLMKDGGGGQWDMASGSADIALELVYSGDVRPMNTALITDWPNFQTVFKSPAFNTVDGVHYGISLQWGPNTLLYTTRKFPNKPTSWQVIYDPANKGLITVQDNAMQIADAALYLSKTQPSLGIKDPFELTKKQFDAAVALLTEQRPLINKYWAIPTDETSLFQGGSVMVGTSWPYQTIQLQTGGIPVADTIPSEGATAWADSWMLATKAQHINCAYLWTAYVSTPHVQAQQALLFGETPVNSRACAEMEAVSPGSCSQYHADASDSYFTNISFWKTPLATCDDGKPICVPYDQWTSAWTTVKG